MSVRSAPPTPSGLVLVRPAGGMGSLFMASVEILLSRHLHCAAARAWQKKSGHSWGAASHQARRVGELCPTARDSVTVCVCE